MLSERQERFCRLYVFGVDEKGQVAEKNGKHLPLADIYALAGFKSEGAKRRTLGDNASSLLNRPNIRERVSELRASINSELIRRTAWSKEQMLEDLKKVFDDAIEASKRPVFNEDGEQIGTEFDPQAANVVDKIAGRVSKMLGFDEAEKVENQIVVTFGGDDISKWAN